MCVLLQISVQCQDRALPLLYSFLALHPPETRPSSLLFTLLCVNTIGSRQMQGKLYETCRYSTRLSILLAQALRNTYKASLCGLCTLSDELPSLACLPAKHKLSIC